MHVQRYCRPRLWRPGLANWPGNRCRSALKMGLTTSVSTGRAILAAAAILSSGVGCADRGRATHPAWHRGFIAFVGASEHDELWSVLRSSAQRFHIDMGGMPLRVAAPEHRSPRAQANLIRRLEADGLRGLAVQVIDPDAIVGQLESLRTQGVAVVTVMTPVKSDIPFHHCGRREAEIGRTLAGLITDHLGTLQVAAMMYDGRGDGLRTRRAAAFRARIDELATGRILREFDCRGDPRRAVRQMRECMERFPRLGGWVALDNWPLREIGPGEPLLSTACPLFTVDPYPRHWRRITDGTCQAMVGADYNLIGREAVAVCLALVHGGQVGVRKYEAPVRVVTAENLTAFKLDWLKWATSPDHDPTLPRK